MIDINHLFFTYPNGKEALRGISLHVNQGRSVALVGRNGSGKSTLVKHLNGLLVPTKGRVVVGGLCTDTADYPELTRITGLAFQNPDDQICKQSVARELSFGPTNLGYSPEETDELISNASRLLGLQDHMDINPYDLSFSERKLLCIASVLAMDTPLVVLDEPTAGMDGAQVKLIKKTLDRLAEQGKTILIITHDMELVMEVANEAICLRRGECVFHGPTTQLFADDLLMQGCGLLPPSMAKLGNHYALKLEDFTPQEFISAFMQGVLHRSRK